MERRENKTSTNKYLNHNLKNEYITNNLIDNSMLLDENTFDRDEKNIYKYIKSHIQMKKLPYKVKPHENSNGGKLSGNKFIVYKRPESQNLNMAIAYDHMNYLEDLQKMHNIKDIVKNKGSLKFETKKKKVAVTAKKQKFKNKRSATPGVSLPQHYIES